MNTIAILSLVAVITTGLTLIHETRLRRVSHYALCRLIRYLRHSGKAQDRARTRCRDGQ
jgi:hypothetical protein